MKEMYTRFIAEKEQALQKISKGAAKKSIPQGQDDANGHPQGDTSHQQENNAVDVPQEQVAQEGAK